VNPFPQPPSRKLGKGDQGGWVGAGTIEPHSFIIVHCGCAVIQLDSKRSILAPLLVIVSISYWSSCSKEFSPQPVPNSPPRTFLSLYPDSTLNETTSRQHLHWWGVDADGFVVGFFFSFDGVHWTWTPKNDSVFSLPISRRDTLYSFRVSACDNGGNAKYDASVTAAASDGKVINFGAEPFTDLNSNGRWDSGEPFVDIGACDPNPVSLQIPIANSPPRVGFVPFSNIPETTYTVASFAWVGTDPDGDNTIAAYLIALNDTSSESNWVTLSGQVNFVTLIAKKPTAGETIVSANLFSTQTMHPVPEVLPGLRLDARNVFYLRAVDVAGAFSPTIRMPDSTGRWFVRNPRSDLLVIDDYFTSDAAPGFYNSILDTLAGGKYRNYDLWDIKRGSSGSIRGALLPPFPIFTRSMFAETLKLFKFVFWYADNNPSLDVAVVSLPVYTNNGGKVFFSTQWPNALPDNQGNISDFAPVDSISETPITFVPAGTDVLPADPNDFPQLRRDNSAAFLGNIRPFTKVKVDATPLYRLAPTTSGFWQGSPVVGAENSARSFVFIGLPLNRFDGIPGGVGALFYRILIREFGG
jgi:hypothetical protein